MAEEEKWDKVRAAILPITMVITFLYSFGLLQGEGAMPYVYIGTLAMIPGAAFSVYLWFCTKKTQAPRNILTFYAFMAFLMAVAWINWTSNCVVDLIVIFGFITGLPQALLSLTVLAWGNSLGDMSADTAMTKKGFGEMGVTATMAGPIFNILMGQGLSSVVTLLTAKHPITKSYIPYKLKIPVSETDPTLTLNHLAVLPLTLLTAEFGVLAILLTNAILNKFEISFKWSVISAAFYFCIITFLIVYSIVEKVHVSS